MSTFKEFIFSELQGIGGFGKNYKAPWDTGAKQIYGGNPAMSTSDITGNSYLMMSPRRRQMIDTDEPGQKYRYYIQMVRTLIADVDIGKIIAGHEKDVYNVVYTKTEVTKLGYPPEEQKMLEELQIINWRKGYDHKELLKQIGDNDLSAVRKFRHGKLFDPATRQGFVPREGYFFSLDKIEEVRDEMNKWISYQDTIERGLQFFGGKLGGLIRQQALQSRFDRPKIT